MSSEGGWGGRYLTVMVIPDGGEDRRTFRVSYGRLRLWGVAAGVVALGLILMAGSWWYLAARAARVGDLEEQIAAMTAERARIEQLAERLGEVEQRYEAVRSLFGSAPEAPSEVWLPATGSPSRTRSSAPGGTPSSWPLTEPGFVTQGLLDMEGVEHPGIDIAVPSDSYIRAAGGGSVAEAAEDSVYGRYIVLDHGDGYRSVYGHASQLLVEPGDAVRRGQVIALSGSSGRSTAPHLHFEILLDGEAVDPLTLLEQP